MDKILLASNRRHSTRKIPDIQRPDFLVRAVVRKDACWQLQGVLSSLGEDGVTLLSRF